MSLPETIVAGNRQKVASIAQGMLDGQVGIIDGSRQLARLSHHIDVNEFDDDFRAFVGIDSETDDLLVGDARQHWAVDALEKKDAEIEAAEALYRYPALAACKRLVARFGPPQ